MLYFPKHIKKRRKKIQFLSPKTLGWGLLITSLVFLLFWGVDDTNVSSSPLSRFIHTPVSAIYSLRHFCVVLFSGFQDNFDAKNKLSQLRRENEELRQENQELRYKLRRHEHYREAFELPQEEGMPVVVAIVVLPDDRMTQSLIINRGADDGLDINMPVLTSEGLVGRTTLKMTPHAAQVMPITDPRSGVGVYIAGTPYEGILRGAEDGKQLLLTDLQSGAGDESIRPKPGDKVLTSGHGRVFPRDIMVGIISDATTSTDNALVVNPAVNIQSVKAVMVMTRTQLQDEMLSLLSEE